MPIGLPALALAPRALSLLPPYFSYEIQRTAHVDESRRVMLREMPKEHQILGNVQRIGIQDARVFAVQVHDRRVHLDSTIEAGQG